MSVIRSLNCVHLVRGDNSGFVTFHVKTFLGNFVFILFDGVVSLLHQLEAFVHAIEKKNVLIYC